MENKQINGIQEMIKKKNQTRLTHEWVIKIGCSSVPLLALKKASLIFFFMREVGDGYRIVGLEMSPKVNGR